MASSCPVISPAVRSLVYPESPVAQKAQARGHPTWLERQAVVWFPWERRTDSIRSPS